MHLVLWHRCHPRIPVANKLRVLVDLVWLDIVKYDGMHVLAAGKDLREAPLNVLVELASLGRAVDQRLQCTALLLVAFFLCTGFFCTRC
jgi:hypothetical protein